MAETQRSQETQNFWLRQLFMKGKKQAYRSAGVAINVHKCTSPSFPGTRAAHGYWCLCLFYHRALINAFCCVADLCTHSCCIRPPTLHPKTARQKAAKLSLGTEYSNLATRQRLHSPKFQPAGKFSSCRKNVFQITQFAARNSLFTGKFKGKIVVLRTRVFFVGKLQLPAPSYLFSNPRSR